MNSLRARGSRAIRPCASRGTPAAGFDRWGGCCEALLSVCPFLATLPSAAAARAQVTNSAHSDFAAGTDCPRYRPSHAMVDASTSGLVATKPL